MNLLASFINIPGKVKEIMQKIAIVKSAQHQCAPVELQILIKFNADHSPQGIWLYKEQEFLEELTNEMITEIANSD